MWLREVNISLEERKKKYIIVWALTLFLSDTLTLLLSVRKPISYIAVVGHLDPR